MAMILPKNNKGKFIFKLTSIWEWHFKFGIYISDFVWVKAYEDDYSYCTLRGYTFMNLSNQIDK